MTQEELIASLRLDFKPADTGDDATAFTSRLTAYASKAFSRTDATDEQREHHARALMLGAQIAELLRQVEVFRREGKLTIEQGLSTRIGILQGQQQAAMKQAGLSVTTTTQRASSFVSVPVSSGF